MAQICQECLGDLQHTYLPVLLLAHILLLPARFNLNDCLIIVHSEQEKLLHMIVDPLSPRLHALFVPWNRRRSFPSSKPCDSKSPLHSTSSLQCNQGQVTAGFPSHTDTSYRQILSPLVDLFRKYAGCRGNDASEATYCRTDVRLWR
jgi:hypothetical protein